jgi:hypothetical protein
MKKGKEGDEGSKVSWIKDEESWRGGRGKKEKRGMKAAK